MNRSSRWRVPAKSLGLILVAALCGASRAALAEPAKYELDPNHLSIGFLVDHIGYEKVLGMFRKASGSYTFDEDTGTMSDLRVVIETDSVFSNQKERDEHLRSADFLNSAEFPEMIFTAKGAKRTGEKSFEIAGELSLLGKTRPLTLQATWNKSGPYPFGEGLLGKKPYVMGVSARTSFKRSDFGMSYAVDNGWVGDEVELIIELEARRQ
jgi:polyisoprenoid-binding protein YceI